MNDHRTTRDEPFMRAAALVGDLGNPFYEEERHRDVWNEASAVGYQLVLWLSLTASAGAVWIVGADAVPYAVVLSCLVGIVSWVTIVYAGRLGVRVDDPVRMRRFRMVPYAVLTIILLAGVVVHGDLGWPSGAGFLGGLKSGGLYGFLIGASAGVVAIAVDALRGGGDGAGSTRA